MAGFLLSGSVKFLTRGLPVHPSNVMNRMEMMSSEKKNIGAGQQN